MQCLSIRRRRFKCRTIYRGSYQRSFGSQNSHVASLIEMAVIDAMATSSRWSGFGQLCLFVGCIATKEAGARQRCREGLACARVGEFASFGLPNCKPGICIGWLKSSCEPQFTLVQILSSRQYKRVERDMYEKLKNFSLCLAADRERVPPEKIEGGLRRGVNGKQAG